MQKINKNRIYISAAVVLIVALICFVYVKFYINDKSSIKSDTANATTSREQIPEKYRWNLADLYPNNQEWQVKKAELDANIAKFDQFKGKLGQSADMLYDCLEFYSSIGKEYSRLNAYASQLSDENMKEAGPQAMRQEMGQLGTKLGVASSFVEPEILSLDSKLIQKFFTQKAELKKYSQYIDNIQRLKPHTRNQSEEEIISQAGLMSSAPSDIYAIFKDADMPRPTVSASDGKSIRLDDANYTLYRSNPDQNLRKKVFEDFFGAYKTYESTFGTALYNQMKDDLFYKNVRKYNSSLESAVTANNIPVQVYDNLVASVHENLPTLHRYLQLRKKMLGLNTLHYYDLYTPLVKDVNTTYPVENAIAIIRDALKPLGIDYTALFNQALGSHWIDFYPSVGKSSGGYMNGSAYDVHPYILMNYVDDYNSVTILAHEFGHAAHSYYSNKNQAYINSRYPIFLAEVASTCNEELLSDYMLKHTTNPDERLAILGNELENYRTTIFRQTQFAEFEQKIHQLTEQGKALTGEELSKLYLDILKTYYGQDNGITEINSLYGIEWAYVPHFYYNFYVYQYATSLTASTAISEKILNNDGDIREKYIKDFLSVGSSDYSIPILKNLGVDMTTKEPYQLVFQKMNRIMDEIEAIISSKK